MTAQLHVAPGPHGPHVIAHDRWMTHPDDVDYLEPASRWCCVCGQLDVDHEPAGAVHFPSEPIAVDTRDGRTRAFLQSGDVVRIPWVQARGLELAGVPHIETLVI